MRHAPHRRTGKKSQGRRRPLHNIRKRVSKSESDSIILDFLDELASPRALAVWLLFKYGENDQLLKLTCDPMAYSCPEKFRKDYAATRLFSKTENLRSTFKKKEIALESAREAERLCSLTNDRIKSYRTGSVMNPLDTEWFRAKQLVAKILGPLPQVFPEVGWSKGRTTSNFGDEISGVHKYTGRLDVSWSAQLHALRELRVSPHWGQAALDAAGPCSVLRSALNVVRGNTMITVPKNAKTDRVICYEPHINIRLQLRVGTYLKYRLKKFGIDTSDQSINQRRARLGSKFGNLATIDLSMASDTLSTELVFELLPIDWALFLDDLRSKETLWPDGQWRTNSKFSSMGNGYTFELESLIFYALCASVSENVSVFGDDVIVPNDSFQAVCDVLEGSGFRLNQAKSFSSGYFRESCGFDGFRGFDVTPVYLRKLISSREDVLHFHNAVRDWCSRDIVPEVRFAIMLRRWRTHHPHHLGPSGFGDGHYHVNLEEATPVLARVQKKSLYVEGYWFKSTTRFWRVASLYGDRVSGHFSGRFAAAALCASLGPKHQIDLIQSVVDRRLWLHRDIRLLSHFVWSNITWF